MKKIAIVGAGVAGISAAHYISKKHNVTLYEANNRLGGHSNTVRVKTANITQDIDTGFIVFNTPNYPNFNRFLNELNVESQESDMSFSFYDPDAPFYYASTGLSGLFAQKQNLLNPKFYKLVSDIQRFNKIAKQFLQREKSPLLTMKDFLIQHQFSDTFTTSYLLPMGAAIWSCSYKQILKFPAINFLKFWENHQLITLSKRPTWRTVTGGSIQYINAFKKAFTGKIEQDNAVTRIRRNNDQVIIETANGPAQTFDQVVIATHADQVLALLDHASPEEKKLFSKWSYSKNTVHLHTDHSMLPPNPNAWASWNYIFNPKEPEKVCVSYYMNRLQNLNGDTHYLVTLNTSRPIKEEHILKEIHYTHPIYTFDSMATQKEIHRLSGENNTFYCGSYLGYGFHEDAITSAVNVAKKLGVQL